METTSQNAVKEQKRDAEIWIQNKNIWAMWLLLLTQIVFCIMAMFLDDQELQQLSGTTTLEQFFYTGALLMLAIVGFGLVNGYIHQLSWSSVGFNLLITALCIQLYFFMQIFWVKAQLQQFDRRFSTHEENLISFSPFDSNYGNMNEAVKCALAIIVAFSAVLGRAGVLELYFMSILGTIVYELSHQVLLKVTDYEIGSAKIFLFGGAFGTVCSLMLRRTEACTKKHPNNLTSAASSTTSLLGLLMVWTLFPLLTRDQTFHSSLQTTNLRVINVALSLAGSTVLSAGVSFTSFGFRGFLAGSLAGGISCLSSAPFITNPVYAIVFGVCSASIQMLVISFFVSERGALNGSVSNVFLIQGFWGIILTTVNKQIINSNSNGIDYGWVERLSQPSKGLLAGLIPLGMGLLLGLVLGFLFSLCAWHDRQDHFTDFTYWTSEGERESERERERERESERERKEEIEKSQGSSFFIQERSKIKQKNAYL